MPRIFLQSLRHALRGIRYVWREERNFRMHVFCAAATLVIAAGFRFSGLELALIAFAIALVLGSEIINTFLEDLLTHLVPGHDPIVGKAKDMMAGVVLLNACAAAIVGALTVLHHIRP